MRYFYLISAKQFHGRLAPALSASWRERSFKPLFVCGFATSYAADTPFRRDVWRALVSEILLSSALELPQLETPDESYARLLDQPRADSRVGFTLMQQAIFGSRDVSFGGFYRPEHAGWNSTADVGRLTTWLETVNAKNWNAAKLVGLTAEESEDELAFAREWFSELTAMYRRAERAACVIVTESV